MFLGSKSYIIERVAARGQQVRGWSMRLVSQPWLFAPKAVGPTSLNRKGETTPRFNMGNCFGNM